MSEKQILVLPKNHGLTNADRKALREAGVIVVTVRTPHEARLLSAERLPTDSHEMEERDELAKDAARYRWLRDPCSGAERVIFYCRGDYGRGLKSGSWLDAAIDDAMGKEVSND